MPTTPTSTHRSRLRPRKPVKPSYIPADEVRDPVFGFKVQTGHYLTGFHLRALADANGVGWEPRIDNEIDEVVARELVAADLLTSDYEITDAGRFHLADRRRLWL